MLLNLKGLIHVLKRALMEVSKKSIGKKWDKIAIKETKRANNDKVAPLCPYMTRPQNSLQHKKDQRIRSCITTSIGSLHTLSLLFLILYPVTLLQKVKETKNRGIRSRFATSIGSLHTLSLLFLILYPVIYYTEEMKPRTVESGLALPPHSGCLTPLAFRYLYFTLLTHYRGN